MKNFKINDAYPRGCALVVIFTIMAGTALAQQAMPMMVPCMPSAELMAFLSSKYRETETSFGVSAMGDRYSVFESEEGSFTFVRSLPSGQSCVIGGGRDWEAMMVKKGTGL
jgi:hypothetical protein